MNVFGNKCKFEKIVCQMDNRSSTNGDTYIKKEAKDGEHDRSQSETGEKRKTRSKNNGYRNNHQIHSAKIAILSETRMNLSLTINFKKITY